MSKPWLLGSLELPRDSGGFVRRECPACRRIFKTRPGQGDARALQRRLALLLPFPSAREGLGEVPEWSCLYCGHRAPADEWLTEEQSAHLEAWAHAWIHHVQYEQLAHVHRTLSLNPRPTYVAVPPGELPAPLPPEVEELRLIPLLCCGEEVKALWEWEGPLHCPACMARHGGLSGRQQIHLQLIQELHCGAHAAPTRRRRARHPAAGGHGRARA